MSSILLSASALLFDNDGVLVDSHEQVEQAWRQLAAEFELDAEPLMRELIGRRAEDTLSAHLEPATLERAVERLEHLEVALADQTPALAGALELTAALDGLPWTIVTSASTRLAEARWAGAGIAIPDRAVTADHVTRGKPDPEPYLVGAKRLGVEPSACVVFEDSPAGGESGRQAGATVVAVGDHPWSFEPAARVRDLTMVRVEPGSHDAAITLRIDST